MKNKFMRGLLATCMAFTCAFGLVACGDDPADPTTPPADTTVYTRVDTIEELKTALTNDIADDVIVLDADFDLEDVNDNKALAVESGKNIIDLNGHKIKGVDNAGDDEWYTFVVKGADVELTITDSSTDKTGTVEGRCYGIFVSGGAKLTINGGNFVCKTNPVYNQSVSLFGGELVINGGVFQSKIYEVVYSKSTEQSPNTITVNGGKFENITEEDVEQEEFSLFYLEGTHQTIVFNGGEFVKGALGLVVGYDADNETTIHFTNNAGIAEEDISAWEM